MVADAAAALCGELQCAFDHAVPLCLRQTIVYLLVGDTIFDQSEDEAGVEVVASPDSTDRLGGEDGILFAETVLCPDLCRL